MSIKVVYNACFGGFKISRECAVRMAELGNEEAKDLLLEPEFYGYLEETPRHDPAPVQSVEELGDAASAVFSALAVREISGRRYIIREYDGSEQVIEPEDINWIEA